MAYVWKGEGGTKSWKKGVYLKGPLEHNSSLKCMPTTLSFYGSYLPNGIGFLAIFFDGYRYYYHCSHWNTLGQFIPINYSFFYKNISCQILTLNCKYIHSKIEIMIKSIYIFFYTIFFINKDTKTLKALG